MKNKKNIVIAVIGVGIAVAGYFGVSIPKELVEPVTTAVCSISGWC